jgi:ABC-type antimicrobial peptide transport system permease subunit
MVFLAMSADLQAFVEDIAFEFSVVSWALLTAVLMAIITGLPPAIGAMRLKVVDALRKN